ncbi:tryptophan synthase beta subunit-like PLP-dependent enzyme [Syncephalis fuscata]|nr:tryptophan synthase beta subunit-like PLP-dependent enzyme [Syncephalis fuscata]
MIGSTPIAAVRLSETSNFDLLVKLEYRNPTGSIKDRVADWYLKELQTKGQFGAPSTLVVPTTGNLAIALAARSRQFGFKVIAVVPESTSFDRIHLLKAQGVEIVRTPNVRRASEESCFAVARRIASGLTNGCLLTSQEIINICPEMDVYLWGLNQAVSALHGLSMSLRSKYSNLKVVGVLPDGATFEEKSKSIIQQTWKIEDIGTQATTPHIAQASVDQWAYISDRDAYSTARELIREYGILGGPSGGAVVAAAREYHTANKKHKLFAIINDSATFYPSTLLNDEWLMANDVAGAALLREIQHQALEKYRGASVEDLQLSAAVTIRETMSLADALDQMTEREFSQLPVLDEHRKMIGFVYDADLRAVLDSQQAAPADPVKQWMHRFSGGSRRCYQVITPDTPLAELASFFERHSAAFVTDIQRRWCLGVATKYDLIRFLTGRGQIV